MKVLDNDSFIDTPRKEFKGRNQEVYVRKLYKSPKQVLRFHCYQSPLQDRIDYSNEESKILTVRIYTKYALFKYTPTLNTIALNRPFPRTSLTCKCTTITMLLRVYSGA